MSSIVQPKQRLPWAQSVLALLAFGIAGYAIAFYLTGDPLAAGFIQGKQYFQDFHATPLWTAALVVHAAGGSLALITGGLQWVVTRGGLRRKNPKLFRTVHIVTGLIYVAAILLAALAGGVLAVSAMGGVVASVGFALLDLCWLITTGAAFYAGNRARTNRDPSALTSLRTTHRAWMVRSFALTSAAITLRLWMPIFALSGVDFLSGYIVISWLSWVPNLVVAELIIRAKRPGLPLPA